MCTIPVQHKAFVTLLIDTSPHHLLNCLRVLIPSGIKGGQRGNSGPLIFATIWVSVWLKNTFRLHPWAITTHMRTSLESNEFTCHHVPSPAGTHLWQHLTFVFFQITLSVFTFSAVTEAELIGFYWCYRNTINESAHTFTIVLIVCDYFIINQLIISVCDYFKHTLHNPEAVSQFAFCLPTCLQYVSLRTFISNSQTHCLLLLSWLMITCKFRIAIFNKFSQARLFFGVFFPSAWQVRHWGERHQTSSRNEHRVCRSLALSLSLLTVIVWWCLTFMQPA